MTLIAHSTNFKVPFIVGDLLLSGEKKKTFVPPTINYDVSTLLNEPGRRFFPVDMAQKIYFVTPHLLLAMSGLVSEMKALLKELRQRCTYYSDLRPEHIHQFLQEYDLPKNFSESGFFIMLITPEENNKLQVSQFNSGQWTGLNTPIFSNLTSMGSGSSSYNRWASEDITFNTTATSGTPDYALNSNVCQVARALGIERATLATIKEGFGAGYELAFYTGSMFNKLDEIVYLIFECSYDDQGNMSNPILTKAMYYYYYPDILRITSLDILGAIEKVAGTSLEIHGQKIEVSTFDIPSLDIDAIKSSDNLPIDLSFFTKRIGAAVVVAKKESSVFVSSFFNEGEEGFAEFKSGEYFTVSLPAGIMDQVRAGAKNAYSKI